MLHHRQRPPCQATVAESSVALPPVSVELRHAVLHALNPRHRMPAASTGQHAGPSMPLLRRHHAAPPDDPKTWSAFGTVHLRLPFLRRGRYKMKFISTRHETASLWRATNGSPNVTDPLLTRRGLAQRTRAPLLPLSPMAFRAAIGPLSAG